jgi:glycosyltransferase involved in cell wall biosynthesis
MFDNEFPPLGGGTGVVNLHLFEELSRYPDVHVDLVTSSRTSSNYEHEQFSDRIALYKVPVDNRNIHHATNRELMRYAVRGLRRGKQLARQKAYDLSFAFAGVPAGAMSRAIRTFAGLPYVVSLQGPDVPGFEARYKPLYPFLSPVLRRVWKDAGAVIAISEAHRRMAHAFLPEQDIRIIHNGVDTRLFSPRTGRQIEYGINVLCVGRLIERKGQHHLLEAFARLPQGLRPRIRLTLVGTGDAETALHERAKQLGLDADVAFLGFVPREAMPELYRNADVFVLPSQSEGMSMALLEAMASGLPVVVTDTGGSSELVRPGVNGFIVRWEDTQALADALTGLAEDSQLRNTMGSASRSTAEGFSWPAITQEYLDVCEEVIRTSPRNRKKK